MNIQDDPELRYKILLVEDDPVDIEIVRRHLTQARRPHITVESRSFLQDALQLLQVESFDAVLLDLNLPDCNSVESVDLLVEAWSSGPIIVLTGVDDECHGIDAIRHGAADYLVKDGLSAALLIRTISHSIERHRMAYWIKATGESKDEYLSGVCTGIREALSEILIATSVLVGDDKALDSRELQQVEKIMGSAKRMSQLIDEAQPQYRNQLHAV